MEHAENQLFLELGSSYFLNPNQHKILKTGSQNKPCQKALRIEVLLCLMCLNQF